MGVVDYATVEQLSRTANGRIVLDSIRRGVQLARMRRGEGLRAARWLDENLFPEVVARTNRWLANHDGVVTPGDLTSRSYQQTLASVANETSAALRTLEQEVDRRLRRTALAESSWQIKTMKRALESADPAFGAFVQAPAESTIIGVVTEKRVYGKVLGDWWDDLGKRTTSMIDQQVGIGASSGETVREIADRLTSGKVDDIVKRNAEMIVRTAVTDISDAARRVTVKRNSDLIEREQFLATLDDVTSITCASLDGKTFDADKGPRPPLHPHCRSQRIPIIKSWRSMGIDIDEFEPGARASMNGEVAPRTTYSKWLKGQDKGEQDSILGPARAKMFRGGAGLSRFVDSDYSPLTLEDIE